MPPQLVSFSASPKLQEGAMDLTNSGNGVRSEVLLPSLPLEIFYRITIIELVKIRDHNIRSSQISMPR